MNDWQNNLLIEKSGAAVDKELVVDRILETENLTDELEDSDASWLLDWGIGQLDRVLQDAGDDETAGNRGNALMAVMRKVNRIAGNYQQKSVQDLSEALVDLQSLFSEAFGQPPAFSASLSGDAPSLEPVAEQAQSLPVRELLEFLTHF